MPRTCPSWRSARSRSRAPRKKPRRRRPPRRRPARRIPRIRPAIMVEQLLPQDRLQPALLDRLTDDEPDKKQEPPSARVLSKSRMRQSVLRDLAWLFNATRLETVADLAKVPNVRRSVLNFGMPALSGRTASSLDVSDLA